MPVIKLSIIDWIILFLVYLEKIRVLLHLEDFHF